MTTQWVVEMDILSIPLLFAGVVLVIVLAGLGLVALKE